MWDGGLPPQNFQQTTVHNVALIPNYFSSGEEEAMRQKNIHIRDEEQEQRDDDSSESSSSSEERRRRQKKELKKKKKKEE